MSVKDIQIGGSHYREMAIQPSEFITKNGLGWYEGNAVKYICRHHMKNGKQDLEKAIHYLQLAIDHFYGDEEKDKEPWVDKGIPEKYKTLKDKILKEQPWYKQYRGKTVYRVEDGKVYHWNFGTGEYVTLERDDWYHR